MLQGVKRAVVMGTIAATGVFASISTAHAAGAAQALTHPLTKIEGSGSALKWVPNKLTAKHITGTCSSTNYSFKVTNTTKSSETITDKGTAIGPAIPAGKSQFVCGSAAGTAVLALKADSKAHLTVTFS
jgi:hypothetical protein